MHYLLTKKDISSYLVYGCTLINNFVMVNKCYSTVTNEMSLPLVYH